MKVLSLLKVAFEQSHQKSCHWHPRIGRTTASNTRGFHAASRRQFLDELLVQTHTVIGGIHNATGLPWAASIPITSVLVVTLVRAPIFTYLHIIEQRRLKLNYSLVELRCKMHTKLMRDYAGKSGVEKEKILNNNFNIACVAARKQHGCQYWKDYIILAKYPIWYLVMETLRQTTGTHDGLLRLMGRSITGTQYLGSSSDNSLVPMDPSLASEGMLWFPNLLLPDPTLLLPFILSGLLFYFGHSRVDKLLSVPTPQGGMVPGEPFGARRLTFGARRLRKILALAAGPATLQFPSAMLLYWIFNSLCELGFVLSLHRWIPLIEATKSKRLDSTITKQRFRGPTMQELRPSKKTKR